MQSVYRRIDRQIPSLVKGRGEWFGTHKAAGPAAFRCPAPFLQFGMHHIQFIEDVANSLPEHLDAESLDLVGENVEIDQVFSACPGAQNSRDSTAEFGIEESIDQGSLGSGVPHGEPKGLIVGEPEKPFRLDSSRQNWTSQH